MDADFWHQRWQNNQIGFHQDEANALLVRFFDSLSLAKGSRVFLPLCGKTPDIGWLASRGYRVVGAELSQTAVDQFFAELGATPAVSHRGNLMLHSVEGIDIFVGDIFDLSAATLGPVDAIYDRAALVAFPAPMRERYTAHVMGISNRAEQLLITYEYDQSQVDGPPFSVVGEEVRRHYGAHYDLTLLERFEVDGGLRGQFAATEKLWRLQVPA